MRRILHTGWLAYVVLTFVTMLFHEPWRDEAFTWLMARDMSYPRMLAELRYNGSPGLWHTLIFPFAKLGFPYFTQQLIHWLVACASAWVFVTRSPFHPLLKILFIFSYYIVYEYAVIARVYQLSLLLLYLVCVMQPDKFRHPLRYGLLIGLLAHTTFFAAAAAAFFGMHYLWQVWTQRSLDRHFIGALALMLAGGIGYLINQWPPADGLDYYQQHFSFFNAENFGRGFRMAMIWPMVSPIKYFTWEVVAGGITGAAVFFSLCWVAAKRGAWWAVGLLAWIWAAILYIGVFKYLWPSPRHFGYLLIFTVIALWLAHFSTRARSIIAERLMFGLLLCILSVNVAAGILWSVQDIRRSMSGAPDMARYIRDNGFGNHIIVGYASSATASVLPHLPGKYLWYPQEGGFGTMPHFNSTAREKMTHKDVARRAKERFGNLSGVLFLFNQKTKPVETDVFERLYFSRGTRESYGLYRVRPGVEIR